MTAKAATYVGRFAPSPSGPLHLGSAAAALASYLDAKAHGGRWLLRIEDVDTARTVAGAADCIVDQLRWLGMGWDGPVVQQSRRGERYREAFERLVAAGKVYGCACSRREIADSLSVLRDDESRVDHPAGATTDPAERVYPGTCRNGIPGGRAPRAWRFRVDDSVVAFQDRRLGPKCQHPARDAGDFVVLRADGVWAYQLAVTVDDADAGVTHVVRGEDLLGSTGRQVLLQRALGLPTPAYLHTPLAIGPDGRKLSKQNGATSITAPDAGGRVRAPCEVLDAAARLLGLEPPTARGTGEWLREATGRWARRFGPAPA